MLTVMVKIMLRYKVHGYLYKNSKAYIFEVVDFCFDV